MLAAEKCVFMAGATVFCRDRCIRVRNAPALGEFFGATYA
jgi:hypothetical protein